MYMKNGIWTKGFPPRSSSKGQKIITHRSQKSAVASSGGRLDALLQGNARICVNRCLAPDTQILMADGSLKRIIDIEVGDYVINNQGVSTKVLTKDYRGIANKLIKLRSDRGLNPIKCTPEHKFWVLDLREEDSKLSNGVSTFILKTKNIESFIRWVPAEELTEKTFLLSPADCKLNLVEQTQIDLASFIPDNGTSKVTNTEILSVGRPGYFVLKEIAQKTGGTYWQVAEVSKNRVKFTKDIHLKIREELNNCDFHIHTKRYVPVGYQLGKFFGVLLGDGSHRLRYKGDYVSSGEISIAFNSDHEEQILDMEQIIKSLFGLTCSRYTNKKRKTKCIQLVFYSIAIARMIRDFGKKTEKKLPGTFMFSDKDYLRGLLDGLLQSDGYITPGGSRTFSNTSPHLVNLCYWLLSLFGYNTKIYRDKPRCSQLENGRVISSRHPPFVVRTLTHKNASRHARILLENGVLYDVGKITEKEILKQQSTPVWDIGVRDNRSYVAENIYLSNSLGGLGDIIMATPIAKGAKRKFPKCHVTYAVPTDYANGDLLELLLHIPYIDEIIDYRLVNRDDYDSFTNITRVGLDRERPYEHPPNRIDLFAQACAIPLYGDYTPLYTMLEEESEWGKAFVKKETKGRQYRGLIAIHLRSNDPKRTWPKYRVREFVSLARQRGYFSFLFGWGDSPDEWNLAGSAKVFDYKIRQAAAIMKHCDVLVCPDSSLLHLGGALNMKTVSLFGSMPPDCRINHYPNAIAIVNQNLPCLGCVYADCQQAYYCMSTLLPQAVLTAVQKKIDDKIIVPSSLPPESRTSFSGGAIKKEIDTFHI